MTIKNVKTLITGLLNHPEVNVPILLIGSTGIGKSYLTKQLASENNVEYVDLRLATQETTDLIGIPYRDKRGDIFITRYAKPSWFPEEGTRGILMLEEANRAPEDVRQAIFQVLTERVLHEHKLPDGWIIVSLINPDNGTYHVNQLDPAFKRRFLQIVVDTPDKTDWCVWAKKNNVDDSIIQFMGQFPRLLSKQESIGIEAVNTPAGWDMLSTLRKINIIPDGCLIEVANGIVGVEAATAFSKSLQKGFTAPIAAIDIMNNYDKVKTQHKGMVAKKRNDLLYMTMIDVIATCESQIKLTTRQCNNLSKYMLDSNVETLSTLILRLPVEITTLVSNDEELSTKLVEIRKSIQVG